MKFFGNPLGLVVSITKRTEQDFINENINNF